MIASGLQEYMFRKWFVKLALSSIAQYTRRLANLPRLILCLPSELPAPFWTLPNSPFCLLNRAAAAPAKVVGAFSHLNEYSNSRPFSYHNSKGRIISASTSCRWSKEAGMEASRLTGCQANPLAGIQYYVPSVAIPNIQLRLSSAWQIKGPIGYTT